MSWLCRAGVGLCTLFRLVVSAQAQADSTMPETPPVGIEVLAGTRYVATQLIVRKPFTPTSRLSFLNVTISNGTYTNDRTANELLSLSFVSVELLKGFSVAPGLVSNPSIGFRPTLALSYVFTNPQWTFFVLPRVDLRDTYNAEVFALTEFKPRLSRALSLYSRLQGLYNQTTTTDRHARSYVLGRFGLSRKPYAGGVGLNYDRYGPNRRVQFSYGLFLRVDLFN